jgi:predicted Zn finger-like uncharacterized protein
MQQPMRITTQCPHCGKTFGIDDTQIGRKAKCVGCNGVFQITQLEDSPAEADEPVFNPDKESVPQASRRSVRRSGINSKVLSLCLLSFMGGTGFGLGAPVLYEMARNADLTVANPRGPQPAPKIAPTKSNVPEACRTQLLTYIKAAGKLDSLVAQGINLMAFNDQLAEVRTEFELLEQTWPARIDRRSIKQFKDSIVSYDLAYELWKRDIRHDDPPTEPDLNGWQNYIECAGDKLVIEVNADDPVFGDLRGKRYIPLRDNIPVLTKIAADRFKKGREAILPLIQ